MLSDIKKQATMFIRRQLVSQKVLSLVRNRNILTKLKFSSYNNSDSEDRCTQELPDVWHYKEWEKDGLVNTKYGDRYFRNVLNYGTVPLWTRRFTALPSVQGKNLLWLQLLQADDEQRTAYLKLFTLGLKVGTTDDDSDVVERSRKLFKGSHCTARIMKGLHAFTVTSGSVVTTREKLNGLNVRHLSVEQHAPGFLEKLRGNHLIA